MYVTSKKLDKGRITLSKELREILGVGEFDEVEICMERSGELTIRKQSSDEKFTGENRLKSVDHISESLNDLSGILDNMINILNEIVGGKMYEERRKDSGED